MCQCHFPSLRPISEGDPSEKGVVQKAGIGSCQREATFLQTAPGPAYMAWRLSASEEAPYARCTYVLVLYFRRRLEEEAEQKSMQLGDSTAPIIGTIEVSLFDELVR